MTIAQDFFGFRVARHLLARLQEGQAFRREMEDRRRLVLPAAAVFLLVSIACAAATAIFFAEVNPWLTLPAFLLAPAVFAGSLFVQALAFLSWLESRALAAALGHRAKGMPRELPRLPWALAALVLFAPLALAATLWPQASLLLVGLALLVPVVYARLERYAGAQRLNRSSG